MGNTRNKNLQRVNPLQNIDRLKLKAIVDNYMQKVPQLKEHSQRCLRTERWSSNVVLMVVDAAFTSIGLNYFNSVVPKVDEFRQKFIETCKVSSLDDLINTDDEVLETIWRNKRSWYVAKSVASYLALLGHEKQLDDRKTLIYWARGATLNNWYKNPIGSLKGVGINTYQYLRMMGGIDTVMPDKIVKRVIAEMLLKVNLLVPATDIEFIRLVEEIGEETGYRAIELCWMTWMVQSEVGMSKMEKYQALLPMI